MKKLAVTFLAVVVLVYVGICTMLYVAQRALLYFPMRETENAHAEVVRIDNGGTSLKIWHLPNASQHAILYFGGNAENVAWNIEDFATMFPGTAVYLVNYRGYAGSAGAPSESALFQDAEAVYDYVRASYPAISVIGRSLGSGVAVHLASVRDVRKLALVTPYDSVENVAKSHFSMFPVSFLLKDKYDSFGRASRVGVPTLVLIAEHDRVIPRRHSERLVSAFAPAQVEVRVIEAASHDSISDSPEYQNALSGFLLAADR